MLAATATDIKTQLGRKRCESALWSAEHTGRDTTGMPIHSHDSAERLKPEWMGEQHVLKAKKTGVDTKALGAQMADEKKMLTAKYKAEGRPKPPTPTFTGTKLA